MENVEVDAGVLVMLSVWPVRTPVMAISVFLTVMDLSFTLPENEGENARAALQSVIHPVPAR